MSIKILVVDDHPVIRTGLATLLSGTEIEIVAEAANGREALKQAEKFLPDVILLDIQMPGTDGVTTLAKLKAKVPESKVVILSTYDNPTYIARAVTWGASDYVLKGSPRDSLLAVIRAAAAGQSPSDAGQLRRIAETMKSRQVIEDTPLTQRETQVLRHVALGLNNKEIGRSLNISVETVKEHVQNFLRKIAAKDRTQAAVWAIRKGLVDGPKAN